MIKLSVTLVAAIYVTLIIVPGENHGTEVQVSSSASRIGDPVGPGGAAANEGGWIQALIASVEAGGSTPPAIPVSQRQIVTRGNALIADDNGDLMLATATGEFYEVSAVINPVDLMNDEAAVPSVTVAVLADPGEIRAAATEVAEADVQPASEIWRVAASAVNFRQGPSTNTAILTSLSRGQEVEFLAEAPDDWARLRVRDTGLEGYMAARFLEPVN